GLAVIGETTAVEAAGAGAKPKDSCPRECDGGDQAAAVAAVPMRERDSLALGGRPGDRETQAGSFDFRRGRSEESVVDERYCVFGDAGALIDDFDCASAVGLDDP